MACQSTHYLEACKPSLSWKYLSAASQMGQILGFHRDVALVPETDQSKLRRTRLFWFIVIMDKCLVLRLNRPSTIKDSDLTLSRAHCDDESDVFLPTLSKWIDWSRLQGRIYDDIFSPGALLQPESLRTVRARALATELQNIFDSVSPSEVR